MSKVGRSEGRKVGRSKVWLDRVVAMVFFEIEVTRLSSFDFGTFDFRQREALEIWEFGGLPLIEGGQVFHEVADFVLFHEQTHRWHGGGGAEAFCDLGVWCDEGFE